MADERIPVTVLTGYLGSGKTTLLNRILTENHGQRIAVIENEFGEVGIDQALVVNADEEIFEMNNGCICCTVRGDIIRILGKLEKRRDRFDRILIETTGLADPGPVAQTFFVDEDLKARFRIDGIITLVDAKHVDLHLSDSREVKEQIAFADVLLLNKCDLVDGARLDRLEARIRPMNRLAQIHRTTRGELPLSRVLDVGGFELSRALTVKPDFLVPERPFEWAGAYQLEPGTYQLLLADGPDPEMNLVIRPLAAPSEVALEEAIAQVEQAFSADGCERAPGDRWSTGPELQTLSLPPGEKTFSLEVKNAGAYGLYTQHLPEEFQLRLVGPDGAVRLPQVAKAYAAQHVHDESVSSVSFEAEGEIDPERINTWMGRLLQERGTDLFRMKGILRIAGRPGRTVFQAVHMLLDVQEDREAPAPALNQLVLIGRNLDPELLERGFAACLSSS